jgi:hypothetical protein
MRPIFSPRFTPEMRERMARDEAEYSAKGANLSAIDGAPNEPASDDNRYTKPGESPGDSSPEKSAEPKRRDGLSELSGERLQRAWNGGMLLAALSMAQAESSNVVPASKREPAAPEE